MAYKIVLTKQAAKDLQSLDPDVAKRIVQKLVWFGKQSNPLLHTKQLRESEAGDIRVRIGDYRAIALINDKKKRIEIVQIGHRREIYL